MVLMKDYAHEDNDRQTTRIYTTPKVKNGKLITFIPDMTIIVAVLIMIIAVWIINDKEQLKYHFIGSLLVLVYAVLMKIVSMALHNKFIKAQAVAYYRMAIQFYDESLNGELLASISVSGIKVECEGLTIRVTDGSNEHIITCHSTGEMNNLLKYMDKATKDELPITDWRF